MSINFYILEKSTNQQALLHVCQLVEKHYLAGESVYIHTASKADAERLDQLLWTFKDDSFIAHQVCPTTAQVRIGFETSHAGNAENLINLSNTFPAFFNSFKNTMEIVFNDPTVQQLARERFKKYREMGLEIKTHKV